MVPDVRSDLRLAARERLLDILSRERELRTVDHMLRVSRPVHDASRLPDPTLSRDLRTGAFYRTDHQGDLWLAEGIE